LHGAKNLESVKCNEKTAFFAMQCPDEGSYIAYKKAGNRIVELLIPADTKCSSAITRKCRASKAHVVSITDIDGNSVGDYVPSNLDSSFIYRVGKTVEVPNFEEDRWIECAAGIHHFLTREEAVQW